MKSALFLFFGMWFALFFSSCIKETLVIKEPGDTLRVKTIDQVYLNTDTSRFIFVHDQHITANTVWDQSRKVLLSGYVYVDSNVTLTIEPGTLIMGLPGTHPTLIICRGAQINAMGNSSAPIVFTSAALPDSRLPGDIGGIIICGKAKINVPGNNRQAPDGIEAWYGGNNENDNSGILRYVRIEYPGFYLQTDTEMAGLMLAAVGNQTVIDHIQISYSNGDSFGWSGGSVNCKYLIAYKGRDDDFDTDLGYSGIVQFAVAVRDRGFAGLPGNSNGIESNNDPAGTLNMPFTSAYFSNITLFGPKVFDTTANIASGFGAGILLRCGTRLKIYNSVISGWPLGLQVQGGTVHDARNNGTQGELRVRYCAMAGNSLQYFDASYDSVFYRNNAYHNYADSSIDALRTDKAIYSSSHPSFLSGQGAFILSAGNFSELSGTGLQPVEFCGAFGDIDWSVDWTWFGAK